MDVQDGRLIAQHLEIDIDSQPKQSETPKLKLYNMANFPQKIQLWVIVFLSLASLITNLKSIASSIGFISYTNSSSQCSLRPWSEYIMTRMTQVCYTVSTSSLGAPGSYIFQVQPESDCKIYCKAKRPIRSTSRRAVDCLGTTLMWQEYMLNVRLTWPICKISPGRTAK